MISSPIWGDRVEGAFDGGALLREVDNASASPPPAVCFTDSRDPNRVEFSLETLLMQRMLGVSTGLKILTCAEVKIPG